MEVFAVTIFVSLMFAVLFAALFVAERSQRHRSSLEQDALLPFDNDFATTKPEADASLNLKADDGMPALAYAKASHPVSPSSLSH